MVVVRAAQRSMRSSLAGSRAGMSKRPSQIGLPPVLGPGRVTGAFIGQPFRLTWLLVDD
jgi:hypothetical protein